MRRHFSLGSDESDGDVIVDLQERFQDVWCNRNRHRFAEPIEASFSFREIRCFEFGKAGFQTSHVLRLNECLDGRSELKLLYRVVVTLALDGLNDPPPCILGEDERLCSYPCFRTSDAYVNEELRVRREFITCRCLLQGHVNELLILLRLLVGIGGFGVGIWLIVVGHCLVSFLLLLLRRIG